MSTDTKDDLVTEEMLTAATQAAFPGGWELTDKIRVRDALSAVAPMIAARAFEQCRHIPGLEGKFAWKVGAKAERESCAKIADWHDGDYRRRGWDTAAEVAAMIAAAIRARGET
jgi:hypothetical protein